MTQPRKAEEGEGVGGGGGGGGGTLLLLPGRTYLDPKQFPFFFPLIIKSSVIQF